MYRRQSYALQQQRLLEQQRRRAQLRYQQRYLERLRQDQLRLQSWRYSDYGPYNYHYYRNGSYYETNRYGAQMLQQAVNEGYEEGFRAGQADREDGWRFSPEDAIGYEDASYGYDGYYVDMSEYQYYFREGFRRGYEDGYYSRSQYGRYSNGTASILGAILEQILNLELIN
jgi:flagellar biosynthesis/type III secretory pathway protein FliH